MAVYRGPRGENRMREHRLVELLLTACQECGALHLRDLYVEVALLAAGKEFTSAEIVGHAALPENHRLRAAIEATLGADYGAGKLGKLFAQHWGVALAGIAITGVGQEANAVLWQVQSQTDRFAPSKSDNMDVLPIAALGKRYAR